MDLAFKNSCEGTSLVVQWLWLHAANAGGVGSIPGWGTKIPHPMRGVAQKKNKKFLWSSQIEYNINKVRTNKWG